MEKIQVLMSTYNGERFLREQLDSIFAQKGVEVSMLVRDDGSTDSTVDILREYEEKHNLKWYTGENLGSAKSFMDAIYKSDECPYYAFADQDDIWDDDKLVSAVNMLKNSSKPAFYFSDARISDEHGKPFGKLLYGQDPKINFFSLACVGGILGCTQVFNKALKDVIVKAPFPENIRMHDYYIAMICVGIGGDMVFDINPRINYRQHGGNVVGVAVGFKNKMKSRFKRFINEGNIIIAPQAQEILERYDLTAENAKLCRRVSEYKNNIFKTISVALSPKTHFFGFKRSIFLRINLLFRRR